ncbi:MAG: hypothetical protein EBX41_04760 [Chitinophagia bacterium]|nr:hypothetical protein [Chitinophagia bacterium]
MKNIVLLFMVAVVICFSSCRSMVAPIPSRAFKEPAYKTKFHFGLGKKGNEVHNRYWSRDRYGYKPHPNRGLYR